MFYCSSLKEEENHHFDVFYPLHHIHSSSETWNLPKTTRNNNKNILYNGLAIDNHMRQLIPDMIQLSKLYVFEVPAKYRVTHQAY